jgi:hypothetical protein
MNHNERQQQGRQGSGRNRQSQQGFGQQGQGYGQQDRDDEAYRYGNAESAQFGQGGRAGYGQYGPSGYPSMTSNRQGAYAQSQEQGGSGYGHAPAYYGAQGGAPGPFQGGGNYGQYGMASQGGAPSYGGPASYGMPASSGQGYYQGGYDAPFSHERQGAQSQLGGYAGSQESYGGFRGEEFLPRRGLSGREYLGTQSGYPGSGFQGSSGNLQPGYAGGSLGGNEALGYGGSSGYGASSVGAGGIGQGHRGRGPKGYTRSDDRIKEDISERLSDDPLIDASDVTVETRQGVVTLTGSVDSRQLKHRIEDLVECCSGVKDIENRLTVRSSSAQSSASRGQGAAGTTAGSGTTGSSGTASGKPS